MTAVEVGWIGWLDIFNICLAHEVEQSHHKLSDSRPNSSQSDRYNQMGKGQEGPDSVSSQVHPAEVQVC